MNDLNWELIKTKNPKIPLSMPIFDQEMKEAAMRAFENERFVLGESVLKFEQEFARYCGSKYAVATGSGTAALVLSLIALEVGQGEVITTPASFIASASSIIHAGAKPRFADITSETYTIDPRNVRNSISGKSKAILPVHLYGYPAQMDELREIAAESDLAIVEDACQAHGATFSGKKVGGIGDVGCFSFYPSKNMTVCGDGGMIVTDNESIAEAVASLRDCGRAKGSKYNHVRLGFTERMNTVHGAVGRIQLRRLDQWNDQRKGIARKYDESLSDLPDITLPPQETDKAHPVYHMYVIRSSRRDELLNWLERAGVECGVHYPEPIHLQPIFRESFGFTGGEFPNSEQLCKQALSLPMHPSISANEVEYISEQIHQFYYCKVGSAR
jgi:perosamine synthetase